MFILIVEEQRALSTKWADSHSPGQFQGRITPLNELGTISLQTFSSFMDLFSENVC